MRKGGAEKQSSPLEVTRAARGETSRLHQVSSSRQMAERPATALANACAALFPSGATTPIPVTATRLMPAAGARQAARSARYRRFSAFPLAVVRRAGRRYRKPHRQVL